MTSREEELRLRTGLMSEAEANAFKGKSIARGKLLERFRCHVQEVVDHAEDEGDRVYFGSSNHFEYLKEIVNEMDMWGWDAVIRERDEVDPYAELRQVRASIEKFENKIEDIIAEFGADPVAALQIISEHIGLRQHYRATGKVVEQ
jgi:hypothetical protein